MTLWEVPRRFLICSFHMCIRSSWLAAFSFAHFIIVCLAFSDYLSSTEFLMLLYFLFFFDVR